MTQQNEAQTTETEETSETEETPSSPQLPESEEPSSKLTLEFEEPDFSAITEFVEDDGESSPPVEPPAEEVEPPAEETPPEEPPAEVPEGESPPTPEGEEKPTEAAEAKEDTPPEPEKPAEVTPPEPEPLKIPTQEDLEGMYAEHREKTLPVLEELFKLSDEEAAALDEAPSKVIPKLAGRMMYETLLSTYNAVIAALPTVVGTYIMASGKADEAKQQFFDTWPDLNKQAASPATVAAIRAYRSANPRATLDEIIKGAGVMAMINLGLDPMKSKVQEKTPVAPKAPAKPAAPRGASPEPPVKPGDKPENVFSDLAELYDEDNK